MDTELMNESRYIGDIFRELPDKEVFADYYQSIPEPESLDNIAVSFRKQDTADCRSN